MWAVDDDEEDDDGDDDKGFFGMDDKENEVSVRTYFCKYTIGKCPLGLVICGVEMRDDKSYHGGALFVGPRPY